MKVIEVTEGDEVPEELQGAMQAMREQALKQFIGEMRAIPGLEGFEICQLYQPNETMH